MVTKKINSKVQNLIKSLQNYVDRIWYPPLIGFLAGIDNFIVIVPTDGILISSVLLKPKRWLELAVFLTIGSTLGALVLSWFVEVHGLDWILKTFSGLDQTRTWVLTNQFFDKYGLIVVFIVAVTPIMQHPAVILASLAEVPILHIGAVVFAGRLIKYLIMAYVSSFAPHYLDKLWGLKGEMKDVGILK